MTVTVPKVTGFLFQHGGLSIYRVFLTGDRLHNRQLYLRVSAFILVALRGSMSDLVRFESDSVSALCLHCQVAVSAVRQICSLNGLS